jgi:toxin YoeB
LKITFTAIAWDEYLYWQQTDRARIKRINELIRDVSRNPYEGIGKPEPLRYEYRGYWSRRIDAEHRLVYKIIDGTILIVQCRYHY